jgi:hypothetical protein
MKIKAIQLIHHWKESQLTITTADKGGMQVLYDAIGELDPDAEYDITIKKRSRKRSLRANGYMWTLLGQLAVKLRNSSTELYKWFVRMYGRYEVIQMDARGVESFTQAWEDKGIAWFVDDLGQPNGSQFHDLRIFYGSSDYNSTEMARLIEEVVYECKEQGIETMTPEEIDVLMRKEREYEQRDPNR